MAEARKYRGVYPKAKRFQAYVGHEGKRVFCGSFETAEEAAQAYDAKVAELGLYLRPNFPKEPAVPALPTADDWEGTQPIVLAIIRIDGETQSRQQIYPDTVADYVHTLTILKKRLPPLKVVFDGKHYWLADGFHRYHALMAAGIERAECIIVNGTIRDAKLIAAGSNAEHGRQRSKEDKVAAVKLLLTDPEWFGRSSAWLAEAAKVSVQIVELARAPQETAAQSTQSGRSRVGKDGKARKVKEKKPKEDKPAKNGEILFDWTGFYLEWGSLFRQVDKLARGYGAKESPEAEGLRRRLSEWKKDFKGFFALIAKAAAPEE